MGGLRPSGSVLDAHSVVLGRDFTAYRNHAYRVANLCVALSSDEPVHVEKIALAAAFHDLGIWTHGTFDYLEPSAVLARAHIAGSTRADWTAEVTLMILEHHKIAPYRDARYAFVEAFRRADWIDVSRGLIRFGLSRRLLREIYAAWPSAGFHKRLIQLALRHFRAHPLAPLPMFKL